LDTTIAADVQAPIYASLGEIEKLPWIGLGFPMAAVAVILITGRLFGLFNIKWLIIGYIALFEIGSAICGAAPTANAMIIGRVIAGVGGAGMYIGYFVSLRSQNPTLLNIPKCAHLYFGLRICP
jgi:MFS family permease